MGDGMDQSTARRRAREYGGVAVSARRSTGGRWHLGGWPDPKDVWIVVSVDRGAVLDDGDGLSVSVPDIDDDGRTALDRLVRRGGAGSAAIACCRSNETAMELLRQRLVVGTASRLVVTDLGRAALAKKTKEGDTT